MSVIVKYMSMPKNCKECDFGESEDATWYACNAQGLAFPNPHGEFMAENCPLVELPEKHGDLIDIESKITIGIKDGLKVTTVRGLLNYTAVRLPKTVIEAEDGDTE